MPEAPPSDGTMEIIVWGREGAGAPVVVNPVLRRNGAGVLHIKELDGAGCQFLPLVTLF